MGTNNFDFIRLSKIAAECNVSIKTITEWLAKNEINYPTNPMTQIPHKVYEIILSNFPKTHFKKTKNHSESFLFRIAYDCNVNIEELLLFYKSYHKIEISNNPLAKISRNLHLKAIKHFNGRLNKTVTNFDEINSLAKTGKFPIKKNQVEIESKDIFLHDNLFEISDEEAIMKALKNGNHDLYGF